MQMHTLTQIYKNIYTEINTRTLTFTSLYDRAKRCVFLLPTALPYGYRGFTVPSE